MTKAAELAKMGEVLTNSQIGGRRNMIINGAMQVAQRATSVTGATDGGYKTCDRWSVSNTSQGTWTISQSSTTPSDFTNSLKFDCTTADGTTNASDQLGVDTRIEAKDLIQLNYGASSAKTITLSFHVRSNKTGTYTFEAYAQDPNRGFSKTYTIDSADTWEKKEIVIPGDTSASTNFNDDAEIGIIFKWWLAAGSTFTGGTYTDNVWRANTNANRVSSSNVNLADSTDNEWYITGVQLEVGSQATPFEHRSFGEELALCQRYYWKSFNYSTAPADNISTGDGLHSDGFGNWTAFSSTGIRSAFIYNPVAMRNEPTVTLFSSARANTANTPAFYDGGWAAVSSPAVESGDLRIAIEANVSSVTANESFLFAGGYQCDSEL